MCGCSSTWEILKNTGGVYKDRPEIGRATLFGQNWTGDTFLVIFRTADKFLVLFRTADKFLGENRTGDKYKKKLDEPLIIFWIYGPFLYTPPPVENFFVHTCIGHVYKDNPGLGYLSKIPYKKIVCVFSFLGAIFFLF